MDQNPAALGKSKKNLSMMRAVVHAFIGKEITYYPRKDGASIDAKIYLTAIEDQLKLLDSMDSLDEKYLDRAKDSLKEVKDLTEYQDQKSARLLTIVAFLTAAAGALFAKFVDAYPLRPVFRSSLGYGIPVSVVYLSFGMFIMFVAFGALVSFHATQTRFVWPEMKPEKPGDKSLKPGTVNDKPRKLTDVDEAVFPDALSHLFFKSILRTDPVGWARSFVKNTTAGSSGSSLTLKYYKNYITESYLVAAKCGDKLRYLQPAQKLLQCGIRLLILWLLSLFVVVAVVPTKIELDVNKPTTGAQDSTKDDNGAQLGASAMGGGSGLHEAQRDKAAGASTPVSSPIAGRCPVSGAASAAQESPTSSTSASAPVSSSGNRGTADGAKP
ncbi:hypothetical protein [Caballeronia sp. dw_19]|uniref:hypothetical protein n=1 Tax=Caballeronia sp. dw_19 TaxID=2719791 RepID=UPI001BCC1836|nr:hypothetical protein [Caballeronia sp. dw_19]